MMPSQCEDVMDVYENEWDDTGFKTISYGTYSCLLIASNLCTSTCL